MKEARKSASGTKQNHEKGGIHVLEMGNRYDISCAHVCVGSGWEGEILRAPPEQDGWAQKLANHSGSGESWYLYLMKFPTENDAELLDKCKTVVDATTVLHLSRSSASFSVGNFIR